MKKKVLSTILAGVLALSAFAGCGSSTEESTEHQCSNKGRDARSCNGGGCEC